MKIINFFKKTHYFWVFLFFLCFFLIAQFSLNYFADTDTYYNLKHSNLIAENSFKPLVSPWAKFHFLSYAPTDGYFLFHEILAVFIKFFGMIPGGKIAGALGATSIYLLFYCLAYKVDNKKAWLYTIIFFISSPVFIARLLQIRAFVPSVFLTMLIYYFLSKNKYKLVIILTAILTLLYNLSVIILFWGIMDTIYRYLSEKKLNLKPLISCLLGLLIGLILHPLAFNYLNLIYTHLVMIPVLKMQGVLFNGGNEIKYRGLNFFFGSNLLACIIYIFFVSIWIINFLQQRIKTWREDARLLLISLPWFFISILYVRGTEYWIPFGALFCLYSIELYKESKLKQKFTALSLYLKSNAEFIKIILLILILLIFLLNISDLFWKIQARNKDTSYNEFATANDYLIKNTPEKSIVCLPTWDMFAPMFYFNTHNIYTAAFDPVFSYAYDPKIFLTLNTFSYPDRLCKQQACKYSEIEKNFKNLPQIMHQELNCEYLVVAKERFPILSFYLKHSPKLFKELTPNQSKITIYQLLPQAK